MPQSFRLQHWQRGFTLIEVAIATLVLSVGVLALIAELTTGMTFMNTSQADFIAQQKAAEAVETVFTARDTRILTWAQIRNVKGSSGSDGGVFLDGPLPLVDPGPDGLVNTADDNTGSPDVIISPGPDGVLGDGDDVKIPLTGFTRQIQITDIAPNLRQVQVIMRYQVGHLQRTFTLTTYISAFV